MGLLKIFRRASMLAYALDFSMAYCVEVFMLKQIFDRSNDISK